ncbi:response regulator [Cohnella herbarum]|uniref:Response regulator n=1 Tax=Cohnella herbarum TaxID=2728023 RepID=A0A7Z2VLL7_9BACL|nr:response regulator [Cohnella herbarum]QJD85184.1 response regulator [Cohnella herbarum]
MYRVMVIEDEPPLIRDIQYEIERISSFFKVTMTAINGAEALKKLETETPDVIFTDIRMPVMDGLQLIKEVRKRDADIPFVILSGYRDFGYAQEALKFHAYDYLLKPVSPDDLQEVLHKLRSKLDGTKEEKVRSALASALHGEMLENEVDELFLKGRTAVLLVAHCGGMFAEASGTTPSMALPTNSEIEIRLANMLGPGNKIHAFNGSAPTEKIAIFVCDDEGAQVTEDSAELALALQNSLSAQSRTTINVAIGEPIARLRDIGASLFSLRKLLRQRSEFGVSKMIREHSTSQEEPSYPVAILSDARIDSLRTMIQLQQKSLFKAEMSSLFETWQSSRLHAVDFAALLKRTIHALGDAHWPQSSEIDSVIDEAMKSRSSYDAVRDELWPWLEGALFENESPRNSPESVVDLLDDHLRANCHSNIDIKRLALSVGLTAPYLSKLFKLYRGMPLIEYVSYLKIEKAKQLIRSDPNLLAKEIGDLLGFADPFYFSRLFKKFEGCSPSDYRKRLEVRNK